MKVICLFSARDFYGEGECLATFYSKQMITTTISTTSTLDTLLLASRETVVVQSWPLCARSRQQQQSAPHQLYTHQQLTRCCFYISLGTKKVKSTFTIIATSSPKNMTEEKRYHLMATPQTTAAA
jgi:hypothetical protein